MKIITLCGSLRFQKEMMQVAKELSLNGDCVLSPIYFSLQENNITKEQLLNLKQAHFKRIELADAILIIDIDHYVGKSTTKEIEYAKQLGKEILYYTNLFM